VETFPHHSQENEYDPTEDILKELALQNDALNDRLAINAMDATAEEKALAEATISSLREENRVLTIESNALKISRDSYMNREAELIGQCKRFQAVIKKLNKQIEALQTQLNKRVEEEPLPF